VPAVPSSFIEPLWVQFEALLPAHHDDHPLGCHNPRIGDRLVFDKLVARLVLGGSYEKHADQTCSATTMRRRRDEWVTADVFTQIEQIALDAYDKIIGLDLNTIVIDGSIAKAPCGGQAAGPSPVDRGKSGTKRHNMTDGQGIPLGVVVTGANRNDSILLEDTLDLLARFGDRLPCPASIGVALDAGYDSNLTRERLKARGLNGIITAKGEKIPINKTPRWVVERTNSWHARGFQLLLVCLERRTEVIDAWIALANAIIIIRRLIRQAWDTHRWETRPRRRP